MGSDMSPGMELCIDVRLDIELGIELTVGLAVRLDAGLGVVVKASRGIIGGFFPKLSFRDSCEYEEFCCGGMPLEGLYMVGERPGGEFI